MQNIRIPKINGLMNTHSLLIDIESSSSAYEHEITAACVHDILETYGRNKPYRYSQGLAQFSERDLVMYYLHCLKDALSEELNSGTL